MHQRGFVAALFVVACVRGRRPAPSFLRRSFLKFRIKSISRKRTTRQCHARIQCRLVRSYLVLNLARLAAFQYGSSKPPERFFFFPPGAALELAL